MKVPPSSLLISFLLFVLWTLLFSLTHVAYARLRRVPIEEFGLFMGPRLVSFRIRSTRVRINAIPSGSYVKFAERGAPDPWIAPGARPSRTIDDLSVLDRIAMNLSAPAFIFLCAVLCLGLPRAAGSFINTYPELLNGSVHSTYATSFARSFFNGIPTKSLLITAGVLAAKLSAINCLPFPITCGGAIYIEPMRTANPNFAKSKTYHLLSLASFGITLGGLVLWLIAIFLAIFSGG